MKTMILKTILELNWFKHHPSSDQQLRFQRYATRLYILIVVSTLIIMTCYISLSETTYHQTILNPTQHQYERLQQIYPNNLLCSCSFISTSYATFISIQPHFHQLCSSDLLSDAWFQYLSMNFNWNSILLPSDYRIMATNSFKSLAMFCTTAFETITNSKIIFFQRKFISSQVVSAELFQSQIEAAFDNWQFITTNQYLHTLELIRATTHGNHLMNDINVYFHTNVASRKTIIKPMIYSNCTCALSLSCRTNMAIYQNDFSSNNILELYRIPNFFLGCLPIEGLLESTLECFYNRSCMMEIDKYMYQSLGETFAFAPLDDRLSDPTEKIESIVNRLMITDWSMNVSFSAYYEKCAPESCTYEYVDRKNLVSVVTTIVGVFGGLSFAFEMIVFIILRLIEKIILVRIPYLNLMQFIKNLFKFGDEQRMIKQLHFVLVLTSLSALYIFTTFTSKLLTVEIKNPSLNTYQELLTRFPQSLECPCSQLSIKYETIFSITTSFHQVCSSDFVTDRWIAHLYGNDSPVDQYLPTDFLYSASGQFQLLTSLCKLSEKTVTDALVNLFSRDLVNANLLPNDLFTPHVTTVINEFLNALPSSFLFTLSLIRETTGANMIMTTLSTNWIIATPPVITNRSIAHTTPLIYQQCSCALSPQCVQPSRNMYAGCYPLETLLQTTFECLYNQQCIDPTNHFQAMNSTQPTVFDINTTIESIVNKLMIEEILTRASYTAYFTQCAPSSCRYSYIEHNNIMDGVTYLLSLYGGLMVICRIVAILIIKLFLRRTNRVNPVSNQSILMN